MGQSYLGQRIYYNILQGFVNIGGVLDGVVAFIWEYILVMIRWRWQMQNRIAVFEGFSLRELIKKRGVPMTEAQLHFLKLIFGMISFWFSGARVMSAYNPRNNIW